MITHADRTALLGLLLFLSLSSGSGCTTRKARWNYGPLDQPNSEATAATPGGRPSFDPDAIERLLVDQGCTACHTFHGERLVGPPLDRLGGAPRRFADGTTGVVDHAYLVESVLEPSRKVVEGYRDVMPSYADRIDEHEAEELAAYLAGLR